MTIEDIKKAVLEIVELYPISRVTLFGSRANGSERPDSDVDFIIEFNKPVTLITISQITETLENLLQTNVDVIHGPVRETDLLEIDKEVELYAT
ncbi:MAG: nucleotidyltransferase domain-containing protein [Thermoguttaceae bacterium]|nr:nucleotidyltransferase domain-containing protein [Thermoguttaceae bacterium]